MKFTFYCEETPYPLGCGKGGEGEEMHTYSPLCCTFCMFFWGGGGGGSHLLPLQFQSTKVLFVAISSASSLFASFQANLSLAWISALTFLIGLINFQRGNKISRISQVTAIQAVSLSKICFLLLIVKLFFWYCGLLGIYAVIVNSKWNKAVLRSSFSHFKLLKMIINEQHDLDKAKESVYILQRGLLLHTISLFLWCANKF